MALVICMQGAERMRAEGTSCRVRIRAAVQKAGLKTGGTRGAEGVLASVKPGGQAVGDFIAQCDSLICRPCHLPKWDFVKCIYLT